MLPKQLTGYTLLLHSAPPSPCFHSLPIPCFHSFPPTPAFLPPLPPLLSLLSSSIPFPPSDHPFHLHPLSLFPVPLLLTPSSLLPSPYSPLSTLLPFFPLPPFKAALVLLLNVFQLHRKWKCSLSSLLHVAMLVAMTFMQIFLGTHNEISSSYLPFLLHPSTLTTLAVQ